MPLIYKLLEKTCNTKLANLINWIYSKIELSIIGYYHPECKSLLKNNNSYSKPSELFMIFSLAENQRTVKGDYTEVGVFDGTSAKIICEAKGNKKLYLFDTFEGMPEDEGKFKKGSFDSSYKKVKEKLKKYPNVFIHKGLFSATRIYVKDKRFAFVHLDVDTYLNTEVCLEFFYKRLVPNGILISHDYSSRHTTVKDIFDEFFKDKKENIIKLPMSQCMVIKQ